MRAHPVRRSRLAFVAALALVIGPWAATAEAQYFGRNKVQYEDFDFEVLKTEHFDIHYYPEAREAVEQAGRMAERWYARLSRVFNHELSGRQKIILYADHPDFEQTTALLGTIDEATGGVTEAFKRRVVLPMAGSLAETDHVLGHELIHAFQFDITSTSSSVGTGFPTALAMPLWFIEGMAEYLSLGPVYAHTAMWMHDAVRRDDFPSFRQLANPRYFPYRYGHAFWAYIGGRWGDPAVGEILKAAAAAGSVGQAIASVLEISPDELMADWEASIRNAYESLVEKTKGPEDYGRVLISEKTGSGRLNIAPALSPDGSRVVFLSEKSQYSIEMFQADVASGKIQKKILKTALDPHYESLQFINSAGSWHPDGRQFVFAGISKGKPIVTVIDTERGKAVREYKVPEVGEIFNPAWSPDGERIAFVTDRFSTDLRALKWGNYRLALIDPESGRIEPVAGFPDAKHINPAWSQNGSSLYFVSDANGISNIYRIEVATRTIYQVTDLTTGASGITELSPALSVATQSDHLVFSAFEGNRYTLYAVDSEEVLAGGPLEPPLAQVSPAVLPPADRPVGDVMALLDNSDLGLPASAEEFESAKYRAGLSLDYIAPPELAVGADRYGTFVGGGTALFWSDMLGEHTLATLLQVNGGFQDIAALVGYENRKSRWNWGLVGAQIPVVTRGFAVGVDPSTGEFIEQEIRLRQTSREIQALLAYPLSRVQRIEFTARYQNISFDNELETRVFSPGGVQVFREEEDFPPCSERPDVLYCTPAALNLGAATTALVYDNTFFGYTGPVAGQRYRLEVAPVFGSINYVGALGDLRRYLRPLAPYTLAARVLHFGRYGDGGEDRRLLPLFLGYQQIIRGYDPGSFDLLECSDPIGDSSFVTGRGTCPAFDQLFGSRLLVTNFEFRMPFPQGFGLGSAGGFPPLTLAVFFDAGVAWWSEGAAREFSGNLDPWNPVTSYGFAARLNLFGLAILEFDYVHPNNRPQKGWIWQFGFSPGF